MGGTHMYTVHFHPYFAYSFLKGCLLGSPFMFKVKSLLLPIRHKYKQVVSMCTCFKNPTITTPHFLRKARNMSTDPFPIPKTFAVLRLK